MDAPTVMNPPAVAIAPRITERTLPPVFIETARRIVFEEGKRHGFKCREILNTSRKNELLAAARRSCFARLRNELVYPEAARHEMLKGYRRRTDVVAEGGIEALNRFEPASFPDIAMFMRCNHSTVILSLKTRARMLERADAVACGAPA